MSLLFSSLRIWSEDSWERVEGMGPVRAMLKRANASVDRKARQVDG